MRKDSLKINDRVEIDIEKLAFKGYGFGKVDNIVYFNNSLLVLFRNKKTKAKKSSVAKISIF